MNPETRLPIVLVDDEESILFSTETLLEAEGLEPVVALQDGRELMPMLAARGAALVCLDLIMPHVTGLELLREMNARFPGIPTVVMTAVHDVDTAVTCMKEGAFDYLVKPVERSRFLSCVHHALEMRTLRDAMGHLKEYLLQDRLCHPEAFTPMVTRNRKMRAIFQYLESVASSSEPVLIEGETGVGKELLVEALHRLTGRRGSLVAVNVAGLDDMAFSDTLFGHRRGAYTGADRDRAGMIAAASQGTLFLDEIGDLSPALQIKLLRVLQSRRYQPLGSDGFLECNTRFVFATNRNLKVLANQGGFRQDLYFRLAGHRVVVPPLRERKEDIPLLTHHFLEEAALALGKKVPIPPPALMTLLANYPFPGNVRELRAMVFDAVARHEGSVLALAPFREAMQEGNETVPGGSLPVGGNPFALFPDPLPTLTETETWLMREALRRCEGNKSMAADLLGITRQTLARRLRDPD